MIITVYTKDDCVQCKATERKLTARGIKFHEIKLDDNEMALEKVKGLGYLAAPVVVVGFDHPTMGGKHWSGFQPDMIDSL